MTSKPSCCPFCKGQSRVAQSDTAYWVRCNECGAEGPTDPDERKAVAAWDRRATQPAAGELLSEVAKQNAILEQIKSGLEGFLYPPAAAHGDEAVLDVLKTAYESGYQDGQDAPNAYSDEKVKHRIALSLLEEMMADAAMRAQGEGD